MINQLKAASQATTPEHSTGELVKLVAEREAAVQAGVPQARAAAERLDKSAWPGRGP
jgi:hypothetical protein